MKTMITEDDQLRMIVTDDPSEGKICLCNEHYDRLMEKLRIHGIDHLISATEAELKGKINRKEIDPLFAAQEALMRLSMNAIGSEGVVIHRCPVCALNKFDFITQVAKVFKELIVKSKKNEH